MKDLLDAEKPHNNKNFNTNLIVISLVAIAQGVLGLSDLSMNYLYKDDFEMSPAEVSMAVSLTNIPWIVKPLWGFTSDCFPILGKRRAPYLAIFGILAVNCWVIMSLFVRSAPTAIATMMAIQVANAFCNVIGEAMVVEESQARGGSSAYVSLFFGLKAGGTIVTAYIGGLLIELIGKRNVFLITACFPLLLCGAAIILKETHRGENCKVTEQLSLIWSFIKQPRIWTPIMFILLFMSTPSSADALFYFYTNELGFSPAFMGKMRMVLGIGTLLGIFAYNKFLQGVSFKKLIFCSSVLCSVVGCSLVLLTTRANSHIGVPDSVFAISSTFLNQAVGEVNIMPILVLSCRLCPRNIEASLYALLMSTLNLGQLISSQLGGLLMLVLSIDSSNFDNFWILILAVNVIMLLPMPLLLLVSVESSEDTNNNKYDP